MEEICLPERVKYILSRLSEFGFEAYVVGGCVRDSIMGITPNDWDICTSAKPDDVMKVFSQNKIILTGLKHGTITVCVEGENFEVTTYRIDGEYKDNRHPESVQFTDKLELDLMRRDFTINAIAYNHIDGVVDPFGGTKDIQLKIIRCVGSPSDRFKEDALRILRAIRFAIKYGFCIDASTERDMLRYSDLLRGISQERINSELTKMLRFKWVGKEDLLCDMIQLLRVPVPELINVDAVQLSELLSRSHQVSEVRLALLLDFDKSVLEDVLRRLKFSNKIIHDTLPISSCGRRIITDEKQGTGVENNDMLYSGYYERKLIHDVGYDTAVNATMYAQSIVEQEKKKYFETVASKLITCYAKGDPCNISDLEIDGDDLIRIGYSGKKIGTTLESILDMVMRDEIMNTKEDLLLVAHNLYTK